MPNSQSTPRATRRRAAQAGLRAGVEAQTVADLVDAGQIEQAIAAATAALGGGALEPDVRMALLELRCDCHLMRLKLAEAMADAQAMDALARRHPTPLLQAQAALSMSLAQERQGQYPQALRSAQRAERAARRSAQPLLMGRALERLSGVHGTAGADPAGALKQAQQALAIFESLGDLRWQSRAWQRQFDVLSTFGRTAEADQASERALLLARQIHSRRDEGNALNTLTFHLSDMGARLTLYRQALAAYDASGTLAGRATIIGNVASTYMELGLFRRARRHIGEALALARRAGHRGNTLFNLFNLFDLEVQTRMLGAARDVAAEAIPLYWSLGVTIWSGLPDDFAGRIAVLEGRHAAAARLLDQAATRYGSELGFAMTALAQAGRAHLVAGHLHKALAATQRGTDLHRDAGLTPQNGGDSLALWWQHSRALRANGREAEAREALAQAFAFLMETAQALKDEGLRRNYVGKRADNRAVVQAWVAEARAQGLPRERVAAHLAGEASMKEPFERLVDTGLRLNELKSEAELREFLVDEVTELSGADRVLLVLDTPEGPQIAGSLVPQGESEAELLRAVTPWLADARRMRSAALRHGPEGADALDQRSCLIVPLIAQRELLGYLYCDIDGAFGRFHDGDRDLLAMLAAQAAVALANVRAAEALERKVAERTAEARASQAQAEQRAAELSIINSIQQGIAGSLDFQGIVELVGDKLREVLRTQDMSVWWYDVDARIAQCLYVIEHGTKFALPAPSPMRKGGAAERLIANRQPMVYNTVQELESLGVVPGSDQAKSAVCMPIIANDRVLGDISLESHEREHAFGESEIRLLQTVASAMGVALENARLFDETQRLFKQSEQRAAELAIINAVQEALAGELNIQGIYDAVGDKIREIFGNRDMGIRIYDAKTGLEHFPYVYEAGQRLSIPSGPQREKGFSAHVRRTRETLVINEAMEQAIVRHGSTLIAGTLMAKSSVYVPLVAGDQARGLINLDDYEREHAFSDSDVRLLQTLANSMSVALENARLFDETQRLLKVTEQRAAELAVINSIQQGIAGSLDFQGIVNLVGDKLREVLGVQDLSIDWFDHEARRIDALYVVEHGCRLTQPPREMKPGGPTEMMIATRQPEVINTYEDGIAAGGPAPGTDQSKSSAQVPIIAGQVLGRLVVENHDRESAFGPSEVRLLQTVPRRWVWRWKRRACSTRRSGS